MNRPDVVFKKCDTSNHRPKSVKRCVSGTCQHTCQPSQVEKCSHAWTLRHWVNGKQLEKSFRDARHPGHGPRDLRERPAPLPVRPASPSHAPQFSTPVSGQCGLRLEQR